MSAVARNLIENANNSIFLSTASVWEMAIKVSLGRLEMPSPFALFVDEQLRENDIMLLEIKTGHAGLVASLPFYHRDPFDRMIIAQSQSEKLPIISKDACLLNMV